MKRYLNAILFFAYISFFSTGCNRVEWPVGREFCGQIQIIEKRGSSVPKNTELLLYRTDSNYQCCSKAERLREIMTDENGNFNSGALSAGKYFLVVKDAADVVFPMRLQTDYDGKKCSLNTDFSFDKNTRKIQQTVIIRMQSDVLPRKTD